jgi:hypothetical protein
LVISCDVFREELEALALPLPLIRWLEMGLHDRPDELRRRLQEEIDAADKEPGDEPVLLLYGLCGGGLYGLQARRRQRRGSGPRFGGSYRQRIYRKELR